MISLKEWPMAKILREQGLSKTDIARRLGIDRKTVGRALQREEVPFYGRPRRVSKLDPYKECIQRRLERYEKAQRHQALPGDAGEAVSGQL